MSRKKLNYEELGVDPPSSETHDKPEYYEGKGTWKQQGNFIYREGHGARFGSRIPTSHILKGTDEKGMPILQRIKH